VTFENEPGIFKAPGAQLILVNEEMNAAHVAAPKDFGGLLGIQLEEQSPIPGAGVQALVLPWL
jgi:hypothetical protein